MYPKTHNLGFPRIGARRELKRAVEACWSGKIQLDEPVFVLDIDDSMRENLKKSF